MQECLKKIKINWKKTKRALHMASLFLDWILEIIWEYFKKFSKFFLSQPFFVFFEKTFQKIWKKTEPYIFTVLAYNFKKFFLFRKKLRQSKTGEIAYKILAFIFNLTFYILKKLKKRFLELSTWKRVFASIVIFSMLFQGTPWIFGARADEDDPMESLATREMKILSEVNPDLIQSNNFQKRKKVDELVKEKSKEVEYKWGIFTKSEEDAIKKKEIEILGDVKDDMQGGWFSSGESIEELLKKLRNKKDNEDEKKAIDNVIGVLKGKGIFNSFSNNQTGENKEISPEIKAEDDVLKTQATPYSIALNKVYSEGVAITDISDENYESHKIDSGGEEAPEPLVSNVNTAGREMIMIDKTPQFQEKIKMRPVGANPAKAQVVDNKILFEDAYTGMDVLKTSQETGLKEDVIIKGPEASQKLDYDIETRGLNLRINGGRLEFYDIFGNLKFTSEKPFMIDKNGKKKDLKYSFAETGELINEKTLSADGQNVENTKEVKRKEAEEKTEIEMEQAKEEAEKTPLLRKAAQEIGNMLEKSGEWVLNLFSREEIEQIIGREILDDDQKFDFKASEFFEEASKIRNYTVQIKMDFSDMIFPIDLDPTTYVALQDRGQVTFHGDYSDGLIHGNAGFMNGYGIMTRGDEPVQTGGARVENTSSSVIYVDPDGRRIAGKVGSDNVALNANSNWFYQLGSGFSDGSNTYYYNSGLSNISQPESQQAFIEYTFTGTEIWIGFSENYTRKLYKAVIDEGTNNEITTFIDSYDSGSSHKYTKALIATGISDASHTVRVYPLVARNVSADPSTGSGIIHFDYFEYYTVGNELADTSILSINSRSTSGFDFTSAKDSPAISYSALGNVPSSDSGTAERGTFSSWIKTDFAWNADNVPHYIWSTDNQRIYYLYDGSTNGNFYFENYNGTNWTTVQVKSANYTSSNTFASGDVFHIATSWNAADGTNLWVNDVKTSYDGSWTAQTVLGNMKVGGEEKNKLLLHADGDNNDTNDIDSSGNGHQLIFNGDAKISTTQSKFGGESYYFDGTDDHVLVPSSNDFILSADFTIDMWLNPSAITGDYEGIMNTYYDDSSGFVLTTSNGTNGQIAFYTNAAGWHDTGDSLTIGQWQHLAVVRSGTNIKFYLDGTEIYSLTDSSTINAGAGKVYLGLALGDAYADYSGYIDEVRISKGISRWTSNFTPPNAAGHPNLIITEPTIFNYPLTDFEIDAIYNSEVSMGDMINGIDEGSDQETQAKLFSTAKRTEEINQTSKSLLFNYPGVQTADSRVGAFAGGLYKTTAPGGTAVAENSVTFEGNWVDNGGLQYITDNSSYATYTTAENAKEIWAPIRVNSDRAIAEYIIDEGTAKELRVKVDQYASSIADRYYLLATGLENTTHTIKVRSLGIRNPSSSGDYLVVGIQGTADRMFYYNTSNDIATQDMVVNGQTIENVLEQDYATMPNAIQFTDKGNISESAHEGTISLWTQTSWSGGETAQGNIHWIFSTLDSSAKNGIWLQTTSSNTLIQFGIANASATVSLNGSINSTNWAANTPHHLEAKWWRPTSTTMGLALYLNGVKLAENKSQTLTPTDSTNIMLGNYPGSLVEDYDFDGAVHDLSIWSWAFDDGGATPGEYVIPESEAWKSWKGRALLAQKDLSGQVDGIATKFNLTRGGLQPTYANTYDSDTKLLIHSNTTDGSTIFVDSSLSGHSITPTSFSHQAEAYKFGTSSMYGAGTYGYLAIADSSDWDFSGGIWTVDTWINLTSLGDFRPLFFHYSDASNYILGDILTNGAVELKIVSGGSTVVSVTTSTGVITTGNWYHVAFVEDGDSYAIYIDGISAASGTDTDRAANYTQSFWVGAVDRALGIGTGDLYGYIDEFRVSNGVARWTSNFTPETTFYNTTNSSANTLANSTTVQDDGSSATVSSVKAGTFAVMDSGSTGLSTDGTSLPIKSVPDGETKLLMSGEGDSSDSGHSIDFSGNAKLSSTESMFGEQGAYFDGSGDYLTIPDSDDWNFGSGDFAIDFWTRWSGSPGDTGFMGQSEGGGNNLKWGLYWNAISAGNFTFHMQNPAGTAYNVNWAWSPLANTWYHLSVVRSGSDWYFFVNGDLIGEIQNQSVSVPDVSDDLNMGADGELWKYMNGYLDEIRISKGIARWTSDFSAPTGAYSETEIDSYTKLLLHNDGTQTEAKQDINFNGDTKFSSTQNKFGEESMYFDGNGDYISMADDSDWNFGSDDFTIDFWMYPTNVAAGTQTLFAQNDSSGYSPIRIDLNDDGSLSLFAAQTGPSWLFTSQLGAPAATISDDTWFHIAVVRNENSFKTYVNGTEMGSVTNSSTLWDSGNDFKIGALVAGSPYFFYFNGYIDEFRVSKGIARWTDAFSVVTEPYEKIINNESEIDTSGGYLTLGHSTSHRQREIAEYSSYNASTNTFTISDRGTKDTYADSWASDSPVEVGGTVTLSSAPEESSTILVDYYYTGSEFGRERGEIKNKKDKINFLDYTNDASTGWDLTGYSANNSGGQRMATQVAGQNALGYFYGSELSSIFYGDTTNGGVSEFVIDEGMNNERRIRVDQNNSTSDQAFSQITSGLSPGYHSFRIIGGVDETNAGSNRYTTFDAIIYGPRADIAGPYLEIGDADGGNENTINDLVYWPSWEDSMSQNELYLNGSITLDSNSLNIGNSSADLSQPLVEKTLDTASTEQAVHDIIYDSAHSRYYAVGYYYSGATATAVMWYSSANDPEYTTWTRKTIDSATSYQVAEEIVYDSVNDRYYVVGSRNKGAGGNNIVVWYSSSSDLATATWTLKTVESSTTDAYGHGIIYDSNNSIYYVTGQTDTGASLYYSSSDDLATATWTRKTIDTSKIGYLGIVYDSESNIYYMLAFDSGDGYDALVLYSSSDDLRTATWTSRTIDDSSGNQRPYKIVYDSTKNIYYIAGTDSTGFRLWESSSNDLTSASFSEKTLNASSDNTSFSIIFDSNSGRYIIGGTNSDGDAKIWLSTRSIDFLGRPSGIIKIDDEYIKYNTLSFAGTAVTLQELTRGYAGSEAAAHSNNVEVEIMGGWRNNMNVQNSSWYKKNGVFPDKVLLAAVGTEGQIEGGLPVINAEDNSLWNYFSSGSSNVITKAPKANSAANGKLFTAYGSSGGGVSEIDFTKDEVTRHGSSPGIYNGNVSESNQGKGWIDGIDSETKLLIHSDTTDGSTTFTDSSLSVNSISAGGDAHHETDAQKFGDTSIYFDGSGDYLNLGTDPSLDLGTTFTFDAWIRPTTLKNYAGIFSKEISSRDGTYSLMLIVHDDGTIGFYTPASSWQFSSNAGITTNNWYHVAWIVTEGNIYYYVNGKSYGSDPISFTDNADHYGFLGSWYSAQTIYDFNGYIDEPRLSNDVARWTSDFTLPTLTYGSGGTLISSGGNYVNDIASFYSVNSSQYNVWLARGASGTTGTSAGVSYLFDSVSDGKIDTAYSLTADSGYWATQAYYDRDNDDLYVCQTNGTADQDICSKISSPQISTDSTIDIADESTRVTSLPIVTDITADEYYLYLSTANGVKKITKATFSSVADTFNSSDFSELSIDTTKTVSYGENSQKLICGFSGTLGHEGILVQADVSGDSVKYYDYFGETDSDRSNVLVSDVFYSSTWMPYLMSSYASFAVGTDQGISIINYPFSNYIPRPPAINSDNTFLVF